MYKRIVFNVRREVLFMFLYTILSLMGPINLGATVGYSAVVLPILTNNTSLIVLNTEETPLFVSIATIFIFIGIFFLPITHMYGRRYNMLIHGVTFSLGWSLIASSYNVIQLFVGRALTGLATGFCLYSTETYLAEISIASWREVLTVSTSIAVTIGTLVVYFLGYVIKNNWRLIATFFVIPSICFVLCNISFMHESPVWLLSKGRKEAAKSALLRIRGLRQETIEFQEEFASMVNYNELTYNSESSRNCQSDSLTKDKSFLAQSIRNKLKCIKRIIVLPEVWKPFMILNLYFVFQQFSGMYVFTSYTVDIITRLNVTVDPFLITVIVGIIQLVTNVIATCCSKRIGRRTISIVSGVGISISLGVLLVYLQFFENISVEAVPLVCIFLYVGFGTIGFFSLPWSMIPELYPTKYINYLGQFTALTATLCNFIALELYPMMITQDRNVIFYCYFIISIIATLFIIMALPETRAKTKTQIEEAFRGKLEVRETFRKIEDVY